MNHAFAALGNALGCTLAQWRPILILWVLGLALASAVVSPWEAALDRSFTHLPNSAELLQHSSVDVFLDLLQVEGRALASSRSTASQLSLVWILIVSVLMTGLAARMHDRKEHRSWLAASGRFGLRSLLLSLFTFGALAALVPLNNWISGATTGWLASEAQDASARTLGWTMTLKGLLLMGLAGVVITTGQLARVRLVAREERLTLLIWLRSLGTLLRNPVRVGLATFGLARVLSLIPLLLVLWLYDPARLSSAVADDAGWLRVFQPQWRAWVLLQGFQLALLVAFVYRQAVVVKLWPAVAPNDPTPALEAAAPVAPLAPAPAAPIAPAPPSPAAPAAPTSTDAAPDAASSPASSGPSPEDENRSPFVKTGVALAALSLVLASGTLSAQDAAAPTNEPALSSPAATPTSPPAPKSQAAAPTGQPTLRAEYILDAVIDLEARSISATEQATFLNTTKAPVSELWMHLYATAFANTQTIWQDGRSEVAQRTIDDGGTLELRSVRLADGTDIAAQCSIEDTLLRVSLGAPLPPGGSIRLDLDFVTTFPRIIARMGSQGSHIDGMQWYPKFAVHDDEGWQANPFYGTGEFFSDFGSYEVTFRYPTEFDGRPVELEATGIPSQRIERGDDMTSVTYRQSNVHDFAFTIDAAFVRYEDSTTLPSGREVQIVYLCQPYATPKAEQVLAVMKSLLRDSAEWWMEYPYDRIVVDGLPHNHGGGMEYPMLFTISQKQPNHLSSLVELFEDPASVTAHEYGHQYWYGIMASNEVEEAWLDEGFNTWGTAKLEEGHFGTLSQGEDGGEDARAGLPSLLDRAITRETLNGAWRTQLPFLEGHGAPQQLIGWTRSPFHDLAPDDARTDPTLLGFTVPAMDSWHLADQQTDRMAWARPAYTREPDARPLDTPSRDFTRGYGLVYRKTALVLETLSRHVGAERMEEIMRTYVARFRFQHPTKEDFLGVVSELTEGEHDVWLRAAIETDDVIDVTVQDVVSRQREFVGFSDQSRPGEAIRWIEAEEQASEDESPFWERWWGEVFTIPFPGSENEASALATQDGDAAEEAAPVWLHRWVVRRHGNLPLPVEVEARFADGSVFRDTWTEPGGYKIYAQEGPAELTEVLADPGAKIAIDLNRLNDGYRREADEATPAVLAEHSRFWAQTWLNGWLLAF